MGIGLAGEPVHAQVIGTLDHVLLPSAKSQEVKQYLQKIRKDVGAHTEEIAKTQASLQGACGGDVTKDGGVSPAPAASSDAGVAVPPGPVVLDGSVRQ